jgi:hypothetical protein
MHWLYELRDAASPRGNGLAQQRAKKEFDRQIDALNGKRVNWVFQVREVSKRGVGVRPLSMPSHLPLWEQGQDFILIVGTMGEVAPRPFVPLPPPPIPFTDAAWAETLRPGDPVRIQGIIVACEDRFLDGIFRRDEGRSEMVSRGICVRLEQAEALAP